MASSRWIRSMHRLVLFTLLLSLLLPTPAQATPPITGDTHTFDPATAGAGIGNDLLTLAVADLDRDGRLDLAHGDGADLKARRNDGSPLSGWPISTTVGTAAATIQDLAAADLDRDGWDDLVTVTASGSGNNEVKLWKNPTAPFTNTWTVSNTLTNTLSADLTAVVVGDLDRDGAPDVVAADISGTLYLWQSPLTPTAPFTTPFGAPLTMGGGGDPIYDLALTDLDRDGYLDIVTISGGSTDALRLWRNPGTPFAAAWTTTQTLSGLGGDGLALAVADWDHDGDPDLASGEETGQLRLWRNPGSTPFASGWISGTVGTAPAAVNALFAADLDLDGDDDLLSGAGTTTNALQSWQNPLVGPGENGPFDAPWSATALDTSDAAIHTVVAADFDNDGDADVAYGQASSAADELQTVANSAIHRRLAFDEQRTDIGAVASNADVNELILVDLDGDGDLDIVTATTDDESYEIIAWENPLTAPGADTPFTGTWTRHDIGALGSTAHTIVAQDLDGDGDPDLVVGEQSSPYITVWENDGTPFDAPWSSSNAIGSYASDPVRALAVADLDGDGWPDIVSGNGDLYPRESAEHKLIAWRNDGTPFSGGWATTDVAAITYTVHTVVIGDLDNDGRPDVVAGLNRADPEGTASNPVPQDQWDDAYQIQAFRNNGDPFGGPWSGVNVGRDPVTVTLQSRYHGYWGATVYDLSLADLDTDGDLDIVAAYHIEGDFQLEVWENDGTPFSGELWQDTAVYVGSTVPWMNAHAYSVDTGDLDGDGDPDLVSASGGGEVYEAIAWENSGTPFGTVVTDTSWVRHDVGYYTVYNNQTGRADLLSIALGDLDLDGDLDIVAAGADTASYGGTHEVVAWRNIRGQVAYQVEDSAPLGVPQGQREDLMRIAVRHNGLTTDHDAELVRWDLHFELTPGTPLTTTAANNLIETLYVYRDDGDGTWEATQDTPVVTVTALSLVTGTQTITYTDGDSRVQIAAGSTVTFFVVAEMTANATSQSPAAFYLSFDPDADSLNEDRARDTSLSVEDSRLTRTKQVWATGQPDHISIEDQPDGTGSPIPSQVITAGLSLQMYAISRDASGRPVENVAAHWTLTNTTGSVARSDLWPTSSSNTSTYATFHARGVGTTQVLAYVSGLTDGLTGVITVTPGSPDTVALTAVPDTITADGTSTSTITATVTDAYNNRVADGTVVTFTAGLGSIAPYTTTTTNGEATAILTATTTTGTSVVTATAGSAQGTTNVTFAPGPPVTLTLTANPTSIEADGVSTSTLTATVVDAHGNAVADGTVVTFTTSAGSLPGSPYTTTTSSGQATAVLTASTTAQTATITATAGSAQDTTTVTFARSPATVTLTASPQSIAAGGAATSTITATVTDSQGGPVADGTVVTFTASLGSIAPYTTTTSSGQATAVLTSSLAPGTSVVTATAGSAQGTVTVTFAGPPASLTLTAVPDTIIADGTSTSTITATVTDSGGRPVADGTVVTFTTSAGSLLGSPYTTTTTSGQATAVLTASTTAQTATITATAGSAQGTTNVTFAPGPPVTLTLTANPTSIEADGVSTSTLTATVVDAHNNAVADGTVVTFTTSAGSLLGSPYTTTTSSGRATAVLTAGTTAQTATITATAGSVQDTTTVTFRPGAPYTVTLVAVPDTIEADGEATTVLTATVTDQHGNAVADGTVVTFTTSAGSLPGSPYTTTTSSGRATAVLTASTTAQTATITATAGSAQGTTNVTFASGVPATLTLSASPTSIVADGTSTTTLTATVTDRHGNPVPDGTVVTFTASAGSLPGSPYTTTTSSGQATAVLTASTTAQTATITATAGSAQGTTTVTFAPGPPVTLTLTASPAAITADGTSTATLTATVTDQHGNAVADGTVVTFTTSAGSLPGSPYTTTTTNGQATAVLTAGTTAQTATITATAGNAQGTTTVTFRPGSAVTFELSGYPTQVTAGQSWSGVITVTVRDAWGNVKDDFTGTVYFAADDPQATLPYTVGLPYTFTPADAGRHAFDGSGFVLRTAGERHLSVTDGTITATSGTIHVGPAALGRLEATWPVTWTVGVPLSVTVTAYDIFGNRKTDFSGPVTFTATDPQATLPTDDGSGWSDGRKSFSLTFRTAGPHHFSVASGSVVFTSPSIALVADQHRVFLPLVVRP